MKTKRKLKNWVKIALLLLPEAVIIMQLFFVGSELKQIKNKVSTNIIITERRCFCD